jgi:Tol biopolymer transport system component
MRRARSLVGIVSLSSGLGLVGACVGDDPAGPTGAEAPDGAAAADAPGVLVEGGRGGADGGGGASDGDAAAAADAARCDPGKPFGAPINVPNVNTGGYENYVTLTADEQRMLFTSSRNGGFATFSTTWSSATSTFAVPRPEGTVDKGGDNRAPSLTGDGARLYLRSNRAGTLGFNDIWTTTRTGPDGGFVEPVPARNVNEDADDVDPSIQSNGARLYFASDRNGGGAANYQIFESVVGGDGTTGTPTPIVALGKAIRWPVISADGLTLYYGSGAGHPRAKGGVDIWASTRSDVGAAFPAGEPVAELNDVGEDTPGWVSPDRCVLYLVSDRANGAGSLDIWVARRPR